MKKPLHEKYKFLIIGLICLAVLYCGLNIIDRDREPKPYTVTIIKKIVIEGKHSGTPHIVYRLDDGTVRSTPVTVASYATEEIGDRIVVGISDNELHPQNNVASFLMAIFVSIMGSAGFVLTVIGLGWILITAGEKK